MDDAFIMHDPQTLQQLPGNHLCIALSPFILNVAFQVPKLHILHGNVDVFSVVIASEILYEPHMLDRKAGIFSFGGSLGYLLQSGEIVDLPCNELWRKVMMALPYSLHRTHFWNMLAGASGMCPEYFPETAASNPLTFQLGRIL
jgi:hypothetical protein